MALQALGAAVRYQTTFSDRAREIAILVVAAYRESDFEWYAHEAVGRHAGLTDAELDALRDHDYDGLVAHDERAVARATHRLLETGDLDDDAFAEAVDALGLPPGVRAADPRRLLRHARPAAAGPAGGGPSPVSARSLDTRTVASSEL